jgi:hypothetical protein
MEFVPSDLAAYMGSGYRMWPFYPPAAFYAPVEAEHIPAGELTIRRGSGVEATDGRVGRVDEFLIDAADDHITHLVMREGHLWGQKDITIPVSQIDHYSENTVFLKLAKQDIEKLPAIPIRRSWRKEA